MSAVDHAAEAVYALSAVSEIGFAFDDGQRKQEILAEAQVHAALALVEQQRIANLIEVAKWNSEALVRGARMVGGKPLDFDAEVARVDAIFAEVQQRLGLR